MLFRKQGGEGGGRSRMRRRTRASLTDAASRGRFKCSASQPERSTAEQSAPSLWGRWSERWTRTRSWSAACSRECASLPGVSILLLSPHRGTVPARLLYISVDAPSTRAIVFLHTPLPLDGVGPSGSTGHLPCLCLPCRRLVCRPGPCKRPATPAKAKP